ncbi:MAG: CvpA family protein [Dehalobacter sp. 4CP]|uniref:CvpA family protein n=1 Tax=Dehalobacter sp. CP TaxID=2594474 RepID=UPI0013C645C8|nr:CvpA family protein [Dehalobacter sp.]NBJ15787.1 CvpA family protein [Dehalobacter sp. 4CP]
MNTFDYVMLALLVLGGLIGFRKGLITGLSRFIGKIAAIGIAVFFYKPFLNLLEPVLGLEAKLEPKIGNFLTKIAESKASGTDPYGAADSIRQSMIGQATPVLTDYVLKIGAVLLLFILAACIINLIIALVITPIAKNLSFINRGGGLLFGLLSTFVVISLVLGLFSPLLSTGDSGLLKTGSSLLYPWFMQGYDLILSGISVFAGDILNNPLNSIPLLNGLV